MRRPFKRRGILALEPSAWGCDYGASSQMSAPFDLAGDTAIVTIAGPLTQHDEGWWWGCDNYDSILARMKAALESPASAIIMRLDSPGGDAAGSFELARELRALATAAKKKVYAFTDSMAASAAYALACSADGGICLSSTGRVGSVGVIMCTVEQTELDKQIGLHFELVTSGARKADGNPHIPISEGARAEMQAQVDVYAEMFFGHVAAMRPGLSVDAIKALEARVCIGAQAVDAGLADAVMTFDALLAMVASGASPSSSEQQKEKNMDFKELLAALKEKAEGDGDDAEQAKKMLKAIESDEKDAKTEGEGGDEKKDEEEKAPESKKEAEGKDEEEEAKASAVATTVDLAAQVQRLSAEVAQLRSEDQESERKSLLAKHPTLAKELVDVCLKKNKAGAFTTPMSTVRAICKAAPAPKKDPAADAKTATTPGVGQGGNILGGITRASKEADQLDEAFGLKPAKPSIARIGTKVVFGSMTGEEARAHAAAKSSKKETV